MLSARGAVCTDTIMVECASPPAGGTVGSAASTQDVFLLSELQQSWVALCSYVRGLLLQGRDVVIPNWGTFWLQSKVVVSDGPTKYVARRVVFGVNPKFALRYGVDTATVRTAYKRSDGVKVRSAELTELCGVPAHTVSVALREMFLYIGESLYRGKVLNLAFPGICTVLMKKEKFVVVLDEDLQADLFAIDSRRWPPSVRDAALLAITQTPEPSRPSSSLSRTRSNLSSLRPTQSFSSSRPPSRAASSSAPSEIRPAFVAAAPRGRLFADIVNDKPRRCASRCERSSEQGAVDGGSDSYAANRQHIDPSFDNQCLAGDCAGQNDTQDSRRRESVYDLLPNEASRKNQSKRSQSVVTSHDPENEKNSNNNNTSDVHDDRDPVFEEIEVFWNDGDEESSETHKKKVVENVNASQQHGGSSKRVAPVLRSAAQLQKSTGASDAAAAGVGGAQSRRPVVFARDHCSVRELLYGKSTRAPPQQSSSSDPAEVTTPTAPINRRKFFANKEGDNVKDLLKRTA